MLRPSRIVAARGTECNRSLCVQFARDVPKVSGIEKRAGEGT